MKKRELSDDIVLALEATPRETIELLDRFKVGEYWEKSFYHSNLQDTTPMTEYIDMLRQSGLDIGKGDAQFGYKMPIPEPYKSTRYLQIFRRR
jgi:hypothetical protein